MSQEKRASSTQSETPKERQVLTEILYETTAQWSVDQDKMHGKRMSLLGLLREVGEIRLRKAVEMCLADRERPDAGFFPPTPVLRRYIPAAPKRQYCGKCVEGFLYVPDYAARAMYKHPEAMHLIRCQCLERVPQSERKGPFYGEADVIAMMRIVTEKVAKKEAIDPDAEIAEVDAIREALR